MAWDLRCPDWEDRLRTGRSLVPDLPLYPAGEKAVKALDKLRLFDVMGTPTMGEAGGEWFRDVVRALFGSYDEVTSTRYIREVFLLVPKKNNKTTGGALIMLLALLLNKRPSASFLLTAPVQKTADDAFLAIAGAIDLDGVLKKKLHVKHHLKRVEHRETKAKLEIMTFNPEVLTGKKVVGALIDEMHILGKTNKADSAMVQLRGGMQPFPEAFLVTITTQSDDSPAGVFKADLLKAREIRDGKRQGATLPILYEFPREMQVSEDRPWRDSANWHMVNPNLGLSVHLDRLEAAFADEEAKGEAELRKWASQHLNIEIGLALHSARWSGADFWQVQARKRFTLDELLARCEVVCVGIDGGGMDDLLGLAVLGRVTGTHEWMLWTHAYAHTIVLERRKSEAPRFLDFAKDGDLTLVKLPGDDTAAVAEVVQACDASGKLHMIGVDQSGIGLIAEEIVKAGVPFERIIGISQGWKMTGAVKTAERKLAEGKMAHGGQPMMNWVVGNAKVEPRGNAVIITRQASGTAKIDPLLAMFNAVTLLSLNPAPPAPAHQLFFV